MWLLTWSVTVHGKKFFLTISKVWCCTRKIKSHMFLKNCYHNQKFNTFLQAPCWPELYLLRWKPVRTRNKSNHVWLLSELSKVFMYPLMSFTNKKNIVNFLCDLEPSPFPNFSKNVENVDNCHLKNIFTSPFYPF